jgi:transketolase
LKIFKEHKRQSRKTKDPIFRFEQTLTVKMVSISVDNLCIQTIRTLASDVVHKSKSGHPGAPMGCAPMAHVLFSRSMKMNPNNSKWFNRDRFVLSNGHACALQYTVYHLLGYKISVQDLQNFRQLDSNTPGHPENGVTDGVEVSTGPLGQGISNAVGMAIAERHLATTFNKPSFPIIDNFIFVICGDGCLQEGVSAEATSLAGHLRLGNLIVLYDDNSIQIDGDTNLAFTEDVLKRYEAYGWHTQSVSDGDGSDLGAIEKAISNAKKVTDKPSIIKIKTTIGFGSKNQGTEKVHGAPLDEEDIIQMKKKFGFDSDKFFFVPDEVKSFYEAVRVRGAAQEAEWNALFQKYSAQYPQLASELERRINGVLPNNWKDVMPRYTPDAPAVATRKLSEILLNAVGDTFPELMGGSADLTHSNLTRWKTAVDFQADSKLGNYGGRYIRFGVREHGMAAICNGLSAYGGVIPFCATFLNFIGYAQGAFRLSALSHFGVLYIMTHDSIGLGEDGPTHQPVEVLALLRATPNVLVLRPSDGNEVSGAYIAAFEHRKKPSVLCLTRQNLPHLEGSSIEKSLKGAYVLKAFGSGEAKVILVGTGSETSICFEAAKMLESEGVNSTVVSMPCWELFEEQSFEYKASVFPGGIPVVSVEALSTFGWERYSHVQIGMKTFGASAPIKALYKKFGFTAPAIIEKVKETISFYQGKPVPNLIERI